MAILESAANGMLMGMPKQMAPQTEESIIELMGRECVRQFFEVLRINPSLCRVFYDPQASFHYHKVASQTDFITDGQYMYSGKDNVVQALRNLDFVDASVDLLLVRSLEVNLASLLSSINNKEAYESSPPVAGSSSDTKHLLSTSTKSLEQYRIFMTMTTLVLGGHFKILTQSLVMWALSAAPPIMTNVALPGGATPYEYELAAAAAAAFNLQQAAQAPFMPPPQLMMNQFQPTADNVPNAATGILHQLQEPEANTADTFENYNISSSNDANSQQHRPSAVTGAPSSEQHPQSTANSSSATAQFINSDMNNSARNSIVSPRNPPTSTSPSEFISSSSPSVAAAAAQPSSDFGHAVSQQQRALSAATTPVNTLAGDGSRQQYDTNASSDHQHQQHDPYSNFKHQHQPQQQVLGGVAELNQQQQMNSSTDEGYASSLQNADGNGSVDMTSVHAMQYINNIVSQPPTGQILGQPAYNMLVAAPYMNAVNGPASIQHQPMKAYAAAFNNGVAQNQTIGMTQHSFGALQHGSDMPLQLNNGGLSYDQQQPPAYRGYYSTDQPHGGYGGGGYRGGRGGGFNSRGGYNRNFNRDGNFRGGGRGSGERSFNNNERNGGGPTANRGNRGGDGGPFGRNYSNNSSYADHQQQQSNSNNYAFNSNQRGGRDNRKPGVDQPSNASANNSDYRSLQPLPPPPPTSAQQQQQSTTAAVSLSNNVNGSAGGSPANSSRQPNTAVAASGGARPNR